MALTLSSIERTVQGNEKVRYLNVTFDNSYPTGGLAFTPSQVGLTTIRFVDTNQVGGRCFPFDYTNNKLQAFNGTTEVANATDLSAVTVRVKVEGK